MFFLGVKSMKRYFFCGKCKRKKEIENVIIKAALNTILCFFFFFIIYISAVFNDFLKAKNKVCANH